MPDYKTNDPRGWCGDPKRGAALGRPSIHEPGFAGKLTMRIVRLDKGGYDVNGTYFGTGDPLFWIASEEGEVDYMIRAKDQASAEAEARERYPEATITAEAAISEDGRDLDDFTRAYIECALWSSTDDSDDSGGDPLDANYDIEDLAPETLAEMVKDCADFQEACAEDLAYWYEKAGQDEGGAGHDFWLTRNRHGAGFWDRWYDGGENQKCGRRLTDMAHPYGSVYLYVGDDGKIYS